MKIWEVTDIGATMFWFGTKSEADEYASEQRDWLKGRDEDPSVIGVSAIHVKPTRDGIVSVLNTYAAG